MDNHLLEYCKKHFDHAHGMPYMVPPLSMLLGYDGLTPFGHQILDGTANLDKLNISSSTKLLLKHQKSCAAAHNQDMPYKLLMQGFQKWKERTSTSLSGHHLGIYKSLLKDNYKQKSQNNQQHQQCPKTHPHQMQHLHQSLSMEQMSCT